MSKGGGQQTTTTTQQIDPRIWSMVNQNVNRATGIADAPFQAYSGNPYEGAGGSFDPANFVAPLSANQNMAVSAAPGLLGAGQGAVNAGIQGAAGLLNYQPGQINPATAGTATASATGYNPALTGAAPQVTGTGYNASLLGSAPQMQAAQTGPASQASFGPAAASTINRGSVGNVGANSGLGGIAAYQNPHTDSVVNAALSDIDLFRQRALGGNTDRAVLAGGLNGSRQGVADALTNEAAIREAGATAARLRNAGFDMAANLSQQDAARAQQGQAANQAADLSVAGQNANALNNMGQFNAQGLFGASQFNAGAQNATSQANADRAQNAGANNQSLLAQYGLANQGAANAAGQFGASAANDASRVNAGLLSTNQLANQNAQNAAGQFGAGAANTASLANMAALNQGGQFNAGAINDAQARNQQAGLAGAGINANAAGLLGQLGGQQQGLLGNAINTLGATGAMQQGNQQAGLDAGYQEFLRMLNNPYIGQNLVNQSLGLLPQGGTTTQTGPRQDNTMGQVGGLLSGAAAIASLFSDGRLKEDLTFSGYDNEGRRWYTYRYVWDEHGMRRRGVIAQEIMDSDPGAVSVHPSGYLMVDYSKLVRH